jgi:hypothetical protein
MNSGDKVEQFIMGKISDKKWAVRDIINLEQTAKVVADETFNELNFEDVFLFLDESAQEFIKEQFLTKASKFVRTTMAVFLEDAEVDISSSMRYSPEALVKTEEVIEEVIEEEEEIPAITSLKDRIRADAKLLTGDEMREQGMID